MSAIFPSTTDTPHSDRNDRSGGAGSHQTDRHINKKGALFDRLKSLKSAPITVTGRDLCVTNSILVAPGTPITEAILYAYQGSVKFSCTLLFLCHVASIARRRLYCKKMSKRHNDSTESDSSNDASATLTAFINAVFRGQITIYNPSTGAAYDFDYYTEARDLIYTGYYTTEPPSNNGHK